ncbi:RNA/RNP complex-1-interacting phosphatase [Photinus pyralis]|uniref:RNA/RNP complex-1-interacting phosphatase n=1 Tax=Photinus pyralis TaxID=7054 RepID=UPI001266EA4C|nr:RNA/RNP complex-1-interacting phosphatase [Photinus pyralis]
MTEICKRHFRTTDEWFTPAILRERIPKLQLVIDLTFTDRYYNATEFSDYGIQHVKIKCPGGGQRIPPFSIIKRFNNAITEFLRSNSVNEDTLIGVHCTHGLNRTGYFICRYLVEQCKWTPEQSVKAFEIARGHKIEREVYIREINKHFSQISGQSETYPNKRSRTYSNVASESTNVNLSSATRPFRNNPQRDRRHQTRTKNKQNHFQEEPLSWRNPKDRQNLSVNPRSSCWNNRNTAQTLHLNKPSADYYQVSNVHDGLSNWGNLHERPNWRNRETPTVNNPSMSQWRCRRNYNNHDRAYYGTPN